MEALKAAYLDDYRNFTRQFVEFSEEEWAIFSSEISLISFEKKEAFTEIGQVEKRLGYLARGSVRFYFVRDGEELTNYFCFSGEMISSYKSFLKQTPCKIAVEMLEPSDVLVLDFGQLQKLYSDPRVAPKLESYQRKMTEELICCYEDRVMSFVTQSAEERYEDLFRDSRQVLNRIPQHYIANYLGVTPVSLSRIRKRIMERN
ncbi:MAG: Crp/Fnr family transcriptional regulator [Mucilaginibacter polytrichastri]|nr:Crp/Fnr family transcriptional regulator [Mucilaginibacter polytrichastri]